MKEKYVTDYLPNEEVDDTFLVVRKEIRPKKQGGEYLFTVLTDKSGSISAFMWENVDVFKKRFEVDDIVHVVGVTKEYNKALQMTIHKIKRIENREFDLTDYIPSSKNDPDETFDALMKIVDDEVSNQYIIKLINNVFSNDKVVQFFKQCPAAKALHHAYIGGLLDHTLSLVRLCSVVASHYSFLNKSLLIAGALFHDFGKIGELSWGKSFDYTDEGRLIGHITMEAMYLDRKMREIENFPKELRLSLLHIILSHHRELEFGSPKRPKTLEALVLAYLDDLDAKVQSFLEAMQEKGEREAWTPFNQQLQRFIYRVRFEDSSEEGEGDEKEKEDVENPSELEKPAEEI